MDVFCDIISLLSLFTQLSDSAIFVEFGMVAPESLIACLVGHAQ